MAMTWTTISEDFVPAANALRRRYRRNGYTVKVEEPEIGFPYTPALRCIRQNTTLICELGSFRILERAETWRDFACSCGRDTRIVFVVPANDRISSQREAALRRIGIGVTTFDDDCKLEEMFAPKDLALIVSLPDLGECKMQVRRLLGPAYEQIEDGHWREGFESACQALEDEARRYLKRGIQCGRITILRANGNVGCRGARAVVRAFARDFPLARRFRGYRCRTSPDPRGRVETSLARCTRTTKSRNGRLVVRRIRFGFSL